MPKFTRDMPTQRYKVILEMYKNPRAIDVLEEWTERLSFSTSKTLHTYRTTIISYTRSFSRKQTSGKARFV